MQTQAVKPQIKRSVSFEEQQYVSVDVTLEYIASMLTKDQLHEVAKLMGEDVEKVDEFFPEERDGSIEEAADTLVERLAAYLGTENVEADSIERSNVFRALEDMREALR